MSRPKGSKNKKTLLKEAEALERLQRVEGIPDARRENENPPAQHMGMDSRINGNSIGSIRSNNNDSVSADSDSSSNNDSGIVNVLHNDVDTIDTVNVENTENQGNQENQEIQENKKKKEKEYLKCERCSSPIYCEARKIDTNVITGMADYHRTSVRYVRLCDKCCRELNEIVDKWLSDPNSGGNPTLNKWHGK